MTAAQADSDEAELKTSMPLPHFVKKLLDV
jgi:hypothetical protein